MRGQRSSEPRHPTGPTFGGGAGTEGAGRRAGRGPDVLPLRAADECNGGRSGHCADGSCPRAPGIVPGKGSVPRSWHVHRHVLVQPRDLCPDPSGQQSGTSTGPWALCLGGLFGCKRYSDMCGLGPYYNQRNLMSGALKFPRMRAMMRGPLCISQN